MKVTERVNDLEGKLEKSMATEDHYKTGNENLQEMMSRSHVKLNKSKGIADNLKIQNEYHNPGKTGGGPNGPQQFENIIISEAECPIDLKPGCKFKFLCCLEVYLRKLINLDHEGALEGPFLPRVLQNLPRRIHFGVHLGVHDGPGGSSGPW